MAEARYRVRVAALIGCAALGVHEARYLLAYGHHSGEELARQGHAYLPFAGALVVALLALAAVQLLAALTRASNTGAAPAPRPPFWKLWLAASATLVAVHVGQELAEGALAAGHAPGVIAVFAGGGWVCAPLALGFGFVVALCLRGAELAVVVAARRAREDRPVRPLAALLVPLSACLARFPSPLARKLAGRAPPLRA